MVKKHDEKCDRCERHKHFTQIQLRRVKAVAPLPIHYRSHLPSLALVR